LLPLGSFFLKITEEARTFGLLVLPGKRCALHKFDKIWVGLHFGKYFQKLILVQDTKMGKNIPNDHKINQMALKYFQWP
jgi:hypothetical protein